MILSWQENLPDEDMPPEEIWLSETAIKEWFDSVESRQEMDKHTADLTSDWQDVGQMDQNEEAVAAKRRLGLLK